MAKGGARPGAGRKKGAATLYSEALKAEIGRQVEQDATELIAAQIAKAKKGDTFAFNSLLDRFMGKPQTHTDITSKGEKMVIPLLDRAIPKNNSTGEDTESN